MGRAARVERVPEHRLHARRVVLARIVADAQRPWGARRTRCADERSVLGGERARVGEDVGQARVTVVRGVAHVVELVPGPRRVGVVRDRRQVEPVAEVDAVGGLRGPVLDVHLVDLAAAVAAIRVGAEVVQRQAEIGLVGRLVRVLQLEVQRLGPLGALGRAQRRLGDVVLDPIARVAAGVELLEPGRPLLQRLEAHPDALGLADVASRQPVDAVRAEIAAEQVEAAARAPGRVIGDRARIHAECAGDRLRPVLDRGWAFADFDARHARHAREVVRGRRGIRRRCDRHAVFHHRDLGIAVRAGAADADARPDAEALFLDDVDSRHLAQHPVDVGVGVLCQHGLVEERDGPAGVGRIDARRGNDDAFEGIGLDRGVRFTRARGSAGEGKRHAPDEGRLRTQQHRSVPLVRVRPPSPVAPTRTLGKVDADVNANHSYLIRNIPQRLPQA